MLHKRSGRRPKKCAPAPGSDEFPGKGGILCLKIPLFLIGSISLLFSSLFPIKERRGMIENNSHARDVSLSITDSCGRQISLLNSDSPVTDKKTPAPLISTQSCSSSPSSADGRYTWAYQQSKDPPLNQQQQQTRRKYHCTEPGCNKSFTTRYAQLFRILCLFGSNGSFACQRAPSAT